MPKKRLLDKVNSLRELEQLSRSDPRYRKLAIIASRNLGGTHGEEDWDQAMRWLHTNAMETTEKGVVGEVNFCRDLVK